MGVLLDKFSTPFETIPFDKINQDDYIADVDKAMAIAKDRLEKIKNLEDPNFKNVIGEMDQISKELDLVTTVFFNLHHAHTNDKMQAMAQEISPKLSEFSNDITLNPDLFKQVKAVYDKRDSLGLTGEEMRILERDYKSFVRNGAGLNDEDKEKLRALDKELSTLKLKFGENVLKATNSYIMTVENEADLEGLPETSKVAAAELAKAKGQEGKWCFSLHFPSFYPFLQYAKNRELRKELYLVKARLCTTGEFNNQEILKKIACLRYDRANLLGYDTHADFVLEERMAKKPTEVKTFLEDIQSHAKDKFIADVDEVKAYAKKVDGIEDFQKWDFAYYSQALKKEKLDFDDEVLRPYFKLENVINGVFNTAARLYNLEFKKNKDIAVYHEDVDAYEVYDKDSKDLVGIFYTDFFPRESKSAGAWMTNFKGQHHHEGKDVRPHVAIVCNFTKPAGGKPSLITFNEVLTLFHEFGHALHGLLSKCQYRALSGTSVFWDFVELPSQIMENWAYEKECLDQFAEHYETGEKIPQDLIDKINKSQQYMEGYATMRQLSFGNLDMAWHGINPYNVKEDVLTYEANIMKDYNLFPDVGGDSMSCSFSHIFNGGYSSGYYSYKWAEVLDADAFEYFKEQGIFNTEVSFKFRDEILAKGGTKDPMELYKNFRGRAPETKALLKRAGLI